MPKKTTTTTLSWDRGPSQTKKKTHTQKITKQNKVNEENKKTKQT